MTTVVTRGKARPGAAFLEVEETEQGGDGSPPPAIAPLHLRELRRRAAWARRVKAGRGPGKASEAEPHSDSQGCQAWQQLGQDG